MESISLFGYSLFWETSPGSTVSTNKTRLLAFWKKYGKREKIVCDYINQLLNFLFF